VLAVVGPTAAGKSAVGVALAERLGGEVVNADSMQLYRGMDVGTAKLPVDERRGVPHHLLDVWDVTETAVVARYQQQARAAIDALLVPGRVPVLVGGSGLYVRAVLDDLRFPGTDPAARAALEAELAECGPGVLHARLATADPAAAAAILPSNGRRIVRALEVVGLRGSFTATLPQPRPVYPALQVALDRTDLDHRLARRTREMFAGGFVDEVRRLEAAGLREGRTASRALGYAQILQAVDDIAAGAPAENRLARAEAETLAATRRFARRQRSWFRRDPAIRWLTDGRPGPTEVPQRAAAEQNEELVGAAVVTTIQNWWNLARRGNVNL
jgi:tRNA dimethylallyltransferase